MHFSTAAAVTVAGLSGLAAAIDTIKVDGRHFVTSSDNKNFWVNGVDYQPGGSAGVKSGKDPLSDADACARDIFLFQQLGINTIRVYSVDPDIDHDECMTLLAEAGIYLILDVNTPLEGQHLNNQKPWTTYTEDYLEHVFKVMEVFSGYDNTMAYLAGNEVIFDGDSAEASPNYVKAVVRDMKDYMKKNIHRVIPVGYSNADDLKFRVSMAKYLECGETGYVDFWGVNSYQWCGDSTFEDSGYKTLVDDHQDLSFPIIFTEYGCNEVTPRVFQETKAIYSEKMTGVFSGGLVYEYIQEDNNYGLVEIDDDGAASTMKDFTALKKVLDGIDFDSVAVPSDATSPKRPSTCPSEDDKVFKDITANMTLPTTLGSKWIDNGVKCTTGKFVSDPTKETTHDIEVAGTKVSDKAISSVDSASATAVPTGGSDVQGGSDGSSGSSTSSGDDASASGDAGSAGVANSPQFAILSIALTAVGAGLFL